MEGEKKSPLSIGRKQNPNVENLYKWSKDKAEKNSKKFQYSRVGVEVVTKDKTGKGKKSTNTGSRIITGAESVWSKPDTTAEAEKANGPSIVYLSKIPLSYYPNTYPDSYTRTKAGSIAINIFGTIESVQETLIQNYLTGEPDPPEGPGLGKISTEYSKWNEEAVVSAVNIINAYAYMSNMNDKSKMMKQFLREIEEADSYAHDLLSIFAWGDPTMEALLIVAKDYKTGALLDINAEIIGSFGKPLVRSPTPKLVEKLIKILYDDIRKEAEKLEVEGKQSYDPNPETIRSMNAVDKRKLVRFASTHKEVIDVTNINEETGSKLSMIAKPHEGSTNFAKINLNFKILDHNSNIKVEVPQDLLWTKKGTSVMAVYREFRSNNDGNKSLEADALTLANEIKKKSRIAGEKEVRKEFEEQRKIDASSRKPRVGTGKPKTKTRINTSPAARKT